MNYIPQLESAIISQVNNCILLFQLISPANFMYRSNLNAIDTKAIRKP